MRRLLAFAFLLLAAPAMAQQGQAPGERLLMVPPAGWHAVPMQRSDKMIITRLYPPGQDDKQWSELITVQVYPASDQKPRQFVESIITYSRSTCEAAGPGPVTEVQVNGYPMATVSVGCTKGRNSGMGGFVVVQAIGGREALYVVQRQWRGQPFGKDQPPPIPVELLKEWSAFTKTVGLCDQRNSKHPCPQ